MPHENRFEELAEKLARAVPGSVRGLRGELERNFRALLQANLERLELVSRERFEVQAAQLARAQQRLAALEKRIETLEKSASPTTPARRQQNAH